MKCPKCGQENPNDALYCAVCYEVLKKEAPKEEVTPPPSDQTSPPPGDTTPQDHATAVAPPAPPAENKSNYILLIPLFVIFLGAAGLYFNSSKSEEYHRVAADTELAKMFKDNNYLKYTVATADISSSLQGFPPDTEFKTYSLTGASIDELCSNLRAAINSDEELAGRLDSLTFTSCKAEFTWDYKPESTSEGAQWKTVSINAKNIVTYPVLDQNAELTTEESNKWTLILKILLQKEAGRARLNYAEAKKLEIELLRLNAPDVEKLEKLTELKIQNFLRSIITAQDEYDAYVAPDQKLVKLHKKI